LDTPILEENRVDRISKLVRSLNNFKDALSIEAIDVRSEEALKNVKSLAQEIEASYDLIHEPQLRDVRQLHENIVPLLIHANLYESAVSAMKCIEKSEGTLEGLPRDYVLARETIDEFKRFKESINSLVRKSLKEATSYLRSINLLPRVSSIQNNLVGDMLERYYLPKLMEREGYTTKHRVVHTIIGDVQVDVRAEKDYSIGFENLECLKRKDVVIIEAKATVKDEDISDHSKASKAIHEIYQKDSELWKYQLHFQTWLVACYGWDDHLKDHAKREGIIPIDRQDLETRLGKHNLLDRGRPPCPKQ
jgi:hypothetical protein